MNNIIKISALIGIIFLALSFGETREWGRMFLIIVDALVIAMSD